MSTRSNMCSERDLPMMSVCKNNREVGVDRELDISCTVGVSAHLSPYYRSTRHLGSFMSWMEWSLQCIAVSTTTTSTIATINLARDDVCCGKRRVQASDE